MEVKTKENTMNFVLNDKVYNVLKWLAILALPAIGTFYFTLASIWGLPYADEISKTCNALGTLIGVLIGVSSLNLKSEKDAETEYVTEDIKSEDTEAQG